MNLKTMARSAAVFAVAAVAAVAALPALARSAHPARHASLGWHQRLPQTYTLPGDTLYPEGLGYDSQTGNFYAGAVLDGTVVRGNIRQPAATVFSAAGADGRTSALGVRTDRARVFVAGGATGGVWIYNKYSGAFIARVSNGLPNTGTLLNDLAATPSGVYVTDSLSPSLWRVNRTPGGQYTMTKWLDFTGTAFQYIAGQYNADGIQATPDGRYLIIGALNTGKLYRVDIATKAVIQIDTGAADLTNADGLALVGHDLYVARNSNNLIVKVNLSGDYSSGVVDTITTSPRFDYTVGVAAAGERLLVLNAQFEHLALTGNPPTDPTLPFTVTSIKLP